MTEPQHTPRVTVPERTPRVNDLYRHCETGAMYQVASCSEDDVTVVPTSAASITSERSRYSRPLFVRVFDLVRPAPELAHPFHRHGQAPDADVPMVSAPQLLGEIETAVGLLAETVRAALGSLPSMDGAALRLDALLNYTEADMGRLRETYASVFPAAVPLDRPPLPEHARRRLAAAGAPRPRINGTDVVPMVPEHAQAHDRGELAEGDRVTLADDSGELGTVVAVIRDGFPEPRYRVRWESWQTLNHAREELVCPIF